MSLAALPADILFHVFETLAPLDILSIRQVGSCYNRHDKTSFNPYHPRPAEYCSQSRMSARYGSTPCVTTSSDRAYLFLD